MQCYGWCDVGISEWRIVLGIACSIGFFIIIVELIEKKEEVEESVKGCRRGCWRRGGVSVGWEKEKEEENELVIRRGSLIRGSLSSKE